MLAVESKLKKFYTKKRGGRVFKAETVKMKQVTSIKFDLVSKIHLYSQSCLVSSYKAAGRPSPRIVYSSLPKVMARFYSKRSVIRKVRNEVVTK